MTVAKSNAIAEGRLPVGPTCPCTNWQRLDAGLPTAMPLDGQPRDAAPACAEFAARTLSNRERSAGARNRRCSARAQSAPSRSPPREAQRHLARAQARTRLRRRTSRCHQDRSRTGTAQIALISMPNGHRSAACSTARLALAELGQLGRDDRLAIGIARAFAGPIILVIILGRIPGRGRLDRRHDRLVYAPPAPARSRRSPPRLLSFCGKIAERYCVPTSLPWRLSWVGSWVAKKMSSRSA